MDNLTGEWTATIIRQLIDSQHQLTIVIYSNNKHIGISLREEKRYLRNNVIPNLVCGDSSILVHRCDRDAQSQAQPNLFTTNYEIASLGSGYELAGHEVDK
jgi:hypothetical protein